MSAATMAQAGVLCLPGLTLFGVLWLLDGDHEPVRRLSPSAADPEDGVPQAPRTPDVAGRSAAPGRAGPPATGQASLASARWRTAPGTAPPGSPSPDRKSTRLNSSHVAISYAVFCLKKKKKDKGVIDSVAK